MEFKQKLKSLMVEIDSNLDKFILPENTYPQTIYKASRYSLFAGGKRIRPILAIAACEVFGGNRDDVMPFACAIEMIHTYTLIHDDLPAMDNDDYRRGKLTSHKVFGEAMAILAGDGLLNKAAEVMTKSILSKKGNHLKYVKAMDEILTASGIEGVVGGQVVDIESEGMMEVNAEVLNFMHSHKTGALIKASVRSGAIIGGASEEELSKLTKYAENLGLAFQIRDDILDIIGDQQKLGKKVGSDIENNKMTFPAVYGLEESQEMVGEVSQIAIEALKILGEKGKFLKEIADYLINRES